MQKEKREIIYSIVIIIAIPLLVVANTLFISRAVRSAYNSELRRKANSVNAIMAESLREQIVAEDTESLNEKLTALTKERNELASVYIAKKTSDGLAVIARSPDAPTKLSTSGQFQANLAYDKQQPIAKFANVTKNGQLGQAWVVNTPLIDPDTKKTIAVVSSSVLTTDSEEVINKVFMTSLFMLLVTVVIIVALLLRHMRLLGYAQLLAKQREVNQTMSDFLSVATHELKAPMSIIKGYISNVIEDTQPPLNNDAKEQLGVALAQTDRLNGLVQDLLNVSRVEQGRVTYEIQRVVLSEVLVPIVKNYTMIAAEKNITIQYTPDPGIAVIADQGRVQEIFTNLVDNAVKYSQAGSITITVRAEMSRVIISVHDTGIGMTSEQRSRLFQRFYRVKTEETKDISGTGLGLWIIKKYAEAMGGTITVDSIVGSGSEFCVTLPKSAN